jgi:hypothetical protein
MEENSIQNVEKEMFAVVTEENADLYSLIVWPL